jgi:hypothetical protein
MDEELKPCPFCGSKAQYYGECDMVWIRCSNHDCRAERSCRSDKPEDAVKNWNERKPQWTTKLPPDRYRWVLGDA